MIAKMAIPNLYGLQQIFTGGENVVLYTEEIESCAAEILEAVKKLNRKYRCRSALEQIFEEVVEELDATPYAF